MSLSSMYLTGRRGLLSAQAGTNTTSQNIANAETPGYSRRTLRLATDPVPRGGVVFHGLATGTGSGVGVSSLERMRSGILDAAVRDGRSGTEGSSEGARLLTTLETRLAPEGGEGLLSSISDFYDSWSDVAASPTDTGSRQALLASANTMVAAIQTADRRAQAVGEETQSQLQDSVGEVNRLLAEIANLNAEARAANTQGAEAHEVLDRRDQLLDELSGFLPLQVRAQDDGSVTVTIAGMIGVQGETSEGFRVALPPEADEAQVFAGGSRYPLRLDVLTDGTVGAQLGVLNVAIPEARAGLDALASQIVTDINALHASGEGLDGVSGRAFFDPAGTSASTLALSADITGTDAIASGASGAGPGDASIANSIAGMSEDTYGQMVSVLSGVGTRVRAATASADANAAVTSQAEALRDGVSRVDMDEEMTNLIRYQQAYAASARVIDTANSLFDTLLTL